jgi:hypothetical protein
MGFGGLFKSGPSSSELSIRSDLAKLNAAEQQLLQQQAASRAAAAAQRSTIAAGVKQKIGDAVAGSDISRAAALGVLDFIRTSSQGLRNNRVNTGRLTILGN